MPLVNRVALITGGSRGIGRGIAIRLAQEGARIAISYRSNKTAAQQALRQLQASGADCVAVETDVTDAAKAEQLVQTVADRCGRIVNLGAVGAERAFGQAKISAYAAAKAAVVALSRSLALEEAKNGITVNVVNPSSIDEKELSLSEARKMRDARFPIGRPPTVEDVAAAVAFFFSEEAEYVTGQVVNVSGGWML